MSNPLLFDVEFRPCSDKYADIIRKSFEEAQQEFHGRGLMEDDLDEM